MKIRVRNLDENSIWLLEYDEQVDDSLYAIDFMLKCHNLIHIHTLRIHYAHALANLNSEYSKYAKVARALFLYNCTPNISRSADASVSVA